MPAGAHEVNDRLLHHLALALEHMAIVERRASGSYYHDRLLQFPVELKAAAIRADTHPSVIIPRAKKDTAGLVYAN